MNRIKQNETMIKEVNETFEKVANGNLPFLDITNSVTLAVLIDISMSLAVIADSHERRKEEE